MAKRKKGIIITSTCALLAGAAVIAELALGGGTGGNGVGRQQGWQNLQKEIFDSAYSEESYDSAVEVPEYEGEPRDIGRKRAGVYGGRDDDDSL